MPSWWLCAHSPLRSPFSFAFPLTSRGPNSVAFHSFLLDYAFIFLKALLCRSSVAGFQLLFTEGCSSCSFFFFLVSEGEVHILLLPLEIVNFMTEKVKEFLNN